MGQKLTMDDGRKALSDHAYEKALFIREKYGSVIDKLILEQILQDKDCVRFPARIEYNSQMIESGLFGTAKPVSDNPADGYNIYIHEYFSDKVGDLSALVLYHVVSINYGEFATRAEAELFGATVLGIETEYYYNLLCRLVDQIPQ